MNEALISLRRAKPDDASSLAVLMADEAVFGNLLQSNCMSYDPRPQI